MHACFVVVVVVVVVVCLFCFPYSFIFSCFFFRLYYWKIKVNLKFWGCVKFFAPFLVFSLPAKRILFNLPRKIGKWILIGRWKGILLLGSVLQFVDH